MSARRIPIQTKIDVLVDRATDGITTVTGAPKKSRKLIKTTLKIIILIIVLVIVAGSYYSYQHRGGEVGQLTRKLTPYFQLPTEKPSVATITDKNKLSSQSFFSQAENGDKLLIYTNAHEIVLYRPSIGKVIDIAPIQQK